MHPSPTCFKLKTSLSRLVEAIEQGQSVNCDRPQWRPAAKLVPMDSAPAGKRIGVARVCSRCQTPSTRTTTTFSVVHGWGIGLNLLLDTHVALWAIADSPRAATQGKELIASPRTNVWISTASIWEIAIKHSLGRGDMPISSQDALRYFLNPGIDGFPLRQSNAVAVEDLPAHHSDPFDRILAAQALVEPMRLMTHDTRVALL